jgi:hypothetical protein
LEIGNLKLTPYYDIRTRFLKEQVEYLDWYFIKHVDIQLEPLKITIIDYNSNIVGPWEPEAIQEMYDSIACLCFLSLWRNNAFAPLTSDNFTLFVKNFFPSDESLAISSGSFVQIKSLFSSEVSKKLLFIQPSNIPSTSLSSEPWESDQDLYNAISRALVENYKDEWFLKVIRSIRVFNSSYRNDEYLDIFDRLLLLVVAFQSLCVEGEHNGKKFAKEIYTKIGVKDKDETDETNKVINQFALKLYSIRSQYSHGKKLDHSIIMDPDFGNLYKSGVYMYGLTVKAVLRGKGVFNDKEERRLISEIYWGLFSEMKNK